MYMRHLRIFILLKNVIKERINKIKYLNVILKKNVKILTYHKNNNTVTRCLVV